MIAQGIITPVTEPTEWVNSMTYPMKPSGELCICLDPKDLNKAIIREYYRPPPPEEITQKPSRATVSSKFDAYKGFFAYKLDKASSLKTTFNATPRRGWCRYLRMSMGAKCSQDAFQMKMDRILEGLDGLIAIHNDITVYSKYNHDHKKNMLALMECAKATGLTFSSKKCTIHKESVSFWCEIQQGWNEARSKENTRNTGNSSTCWCYSTGVIPSDGKLHASFHSLPVSKHSTTENTLNKECNLPMYLLHKCSISEIEGCDSWCWTEITQVLQQKPSTSSSSWC